MAAFENIESQINTYLHSSDKFLEVSNPANSASCIIFILILGVLGFEFFRRIEKY